MALDATTLRIGQFFTLGISDDLTAVNKCLGDSVVIVGVSTLVETGRVVGVGVVHLRLEVYQAIAVGISITHVLFLGDVVVLLGRQGCSMRSSAPIAECLVPAVLLAGVIGAVLVGLVVWLVVGVHLLVEIVIASLMIEDTAHGEFRDELHIVVTMLGVITFFGRGGHCDHRFKGFFAGHVAGPAGQTALIGFAR